ncbi:HAMP domain-containing histidine kinase [Sporosarcina luteola]|uniref:sensor histidine kinase n=1 Tax=Sporosarcina luteola TaxID=582850 RepID=UPI002041D8CF|nr:HAMP domain-containing sensor histidine kinase [Sporosarcina luteola]MCM3744596.1 HAMP domain-containing histidine kinase [Sporosarcina luteola]
MKLQTRIQLFTTVVLIVLLLAANTSIYFIFKNTSISSELNRLSNISNHILIEMNEKPEISMESMLQAYLLSDGLIRTVVKKGRHPSIQVFTDNIYRQIPSSYHEKQFEGVFEFEDSMFAIVSIPAISEGGEIINLQLIENIDLLYENIQELKWVLVMTTIVVIIILYFTSGFVGRIILLPIQRLTNTMNTIEKRGSFEKIAVACESKDEINKMAMTFNRMMIKLEASYLKQEQFVSDASHELKTPLTVIDSYIKMLKRWGKERPDMLEEAIYSIESESRHMKYLTEQLLQLAKVEEGIEYEKEVVDIAAIVRSTIQRLQPSFKHTIHFLNDSGYSYVKIHEQSFVQLLVILLDNANKYSDDSITVEMTESNGFVSITVKDRGVGIPKDAQAFVFDRMFRVDKTRSRKTGGTGLGLAIAKKVVEQHDGKIILESVEGMGSNFIVTLPKLEV